MLNWSPFIIFPSYRGDWGGRGKHGVLPWRAGQCEHSQHQRPGRPQQPPEHGQWRGLLLLQRQTCLLLLEPRPTDVTTTTFLPNSPALPSVVSIQPCLWNTHIQSHLRWLARTQLIVFPLCSQRFFFSFFFFCPTLPLHAAQPTFGGVPVRALSRLWTLNHSDQHWHQGPRHRLPIGSNLILKGGAET